MEKSFLWISKLDWIAIFALIVSIGSLIISRNSAKKQNSLTAILGLKKEYEKIDEQMENILQELSIKLETVCKHFIPLDYITKDKINKLISNNFPLSFNNFQQQFKETLIDIIIEYQDNRVKSMSGNDYIEISSNVDEMLSNTGVNEYELINEKLKKFVQQKLDLFDRLGFLVISRYIDDEVAKNAFKIYFEYCYLIYYENKTWSKEAYQYLEKLYKKWQ